MNTEDVRNWWLSLKPQLRKELFFKYCEKHLRTTTIDLAGIELQELYKDYHKKKLKKLNSIASELVAAKYISKVTIIK